jgi:hypothetical protein
MGMADFSPAKGFCPVRNEAILDAIPSGRSEGKEQGRPSQDR